jgi:hypothetical protein
LSVLGSAYYGDPQESNGSLRFQSVDCANVADTLHVVSGEQSQSLLWHTIRYADHWEPKFGNVNAQESNGNIGARYAYVGRSGS